MPVACEPCWFGDDSQGEAEPHVLGHGRRCYGVNVTAAVQVAVCFIGIVVAAFDNAFADFAAVSWTCKVGDGSVLQNPEPVVGPFCDVARKIAEAGAIETFAANGMDFVIGIAVVPTVLVIPAKLGRQNPFRFGGKPESFGF